MTSISTRPNRAPQRSLCCASCPPPQLALIDLGLPPVPHRPDEGFQLIAELLAHLPAIRIFVLSGQDEQSNARHARALGAIDFIAKPCAPEKIKEYCQPQIEMSAFLQSRNVRFTLFSLLQSSA